jgi:phospholipid N-methyltransferase
MLFYGEENKLLNYGISSLDMAGKLHYLVNLLKDPMIAAVLPSSRYVVNKVIKKIDFSNAKMIVEHGAGDGVVTKEIVKRMRKDARLFAFEPNDEMYAKLTRINDKRVTTVKDFAQNSGKYLSGKADLMLASIPFSMIGNRRGLLRSLSDNLKEDGKLIIFSQYNPDKLKKDLPAHFSRIETDVELRNVPPAFMFTCQK